MLPAKDISGEPYRATKLWNEAVKFFRSDMPTKKHWHQFKIYQDTFTAAEAVDWLKDFLKNSPNFGPQVTRAQTIQLMRKFLKNHVIEDILGRWGSEDFEDDKRLYRFPVGVSPSKAIRQPLALLNTISPRHKNIMDARAKFLSQAKGLNTESSPCAINQHKSPSDIWKNALITNLQHVLHLTTIEEILLPSIIRSEWLLHNANRDELSLVKEHGMPYWIISAMQCLATWPDSESSGLPNYPGFERDVFEAICGYFQALSEPLLTFNLYQIFINIWIRSEMLDRVCTGEKHNDVKGRMYQRRKEDGGARVETLRRKLLQAQMRHENRAIRRHKSIRHGNMRLRPLNCGDEIRDYQSLPLPHKLMQRSMQNIPQTSWKLNDVATRQTWAERFSSVHALHNLSEEDWQKARESTFGSLPELRTPNENHHIVEYEQVPLENYGTLPRKPGKFMQGEEEHPYGSVANLDAARSASVEDLLLDMSHRLQSEMEFALMHDDQPVTKQPLKVTTIHRYPDEEPSPLYRPMKPCRNWNRQMKQNHRHSANIPLQREKNVAEESIYMEMLPKTPLNTQANQHQKRTNTCEKHNQWSHENPGYQQVPAHDYGRLYSEYATISKPKHNQNVCNQGVGIGHRHTRGDDFKMPQMIEQRRTLKPTQQELEEQLMLSHMASVRKSPEKAPRSFQPFMNHPVPCGEPNPSAANIHFNDNHKQKPAQDMENQLMFARIVSTQPSPEEKSQKCVQPGTHHEFWAAPLPSRTTSHSGDSVRSDIIARVEVPPSEVFEKKTINPHHIRERLTAGLEAADTSPRPQSPLTIAFDSAKLETTPTPEPAHSKHLTESIQICLLLIPPQNRSKLRLLLRLMLKMCENPYLVDLHDAMSTKDFILRELSRTILGRRRKENSEMGSELEEKVVCYLLDHAEVVFSIPEDMIKKTNAEIERMRAMPKSNPKISVVTKRKLQRQATFCQQLTVDEYEKQKDENLRKSLQQLLHDIVSDQNMSVKEKRKRLKQFQKKYPDIYKKCYPNGDPVLDTRAPTRRRPKLSSAIQRLRSLRL